ncbi:hypothetical protein U1Q18_007510 [Sarracenia purpurea var. burkii]
MAMLFYRLQIEGCRDLFERALNIKITREISGKPVGTQKAKKETQGPPLQLVRGGKPLGRSASAKMPGISELTKSSPSGSSTGKDSERRFNCPDLARTSRRPTAQG